MKIDKKSFFVRIEFTTLAIITCLILLIVFRIGITSGTQQLLLGLIFVAIALGAILLAGQQKQINRLTQEMLLLQGKTSQQKIIIAANKQMYQHIIVFDITNNCVEAKQIDDKKNKTTYFTVRTYSEIIREHAEKYVQAEFIDGFIEMLSIDNIIKEFNAGKQILLYEYLKAQPSGDIKWFKIIAYIFCYEEAKSLQIIVFDQDIDEEKKKLNDLQIRANCDIATGLLNKATTERNIENLLTESNEEVIGAIIIMDIDDLKLINDTHGHLVGDRCISKMAHILREVFRAEDIIGRIGGDEFLVFATGIKKQTELEQKIKQIFSQLSFYGQVEEMSMPVSFSIGAMLVKGDTDFASAYHNADKALYKAKQRGKNQYCIFA